MPSKSTDRRNAEASIANVAEDRTFDQDGVGNLANIEEITQALGFGPLTGHIIEVEMFGSVVLQTAQKLWKDAAELLPLVSEAGPTAGFTKASTTRMSPHHEAAIRDWEGTAEQYLERSNYWDTPTMDDGIQDILGITADFDTKVWVEAFTMRSVPIADRVGNYTAGAEGSRTTTADRKDTFEGEGGGEPGIGSLTGTAGREESRSHSTDSTGAVGVGLDLDTTVWRSELWTRVSVEHTTPLGITLPAASQLVHAGNVTHSRVTK